MIKEKMLSLKKFVFRNGKFVFPVIIVLVVAVGVFFALRIRNGEVPEELMEVTGENVFSTEPSMEIAQEDVSLEENTDSDLFTLVATYYNAYASGDVETIRNITNYLDETDAIKIPEMSQYIEGYPQITIYTKPGPAEKSYLAYVYFQMTVFGFEEKISGMESFYVCTDENGRLYMNTGEVSEEEVEYIRNVSLQDDVAELSNRVTEECNTTFKNNTDLYFYIQEVVNDVQKTTGEIIAAQNTSETTGTGENVGTEEGEDAPQTNGEPVQSGPVYATATTTVNVRSSDSELSDKVTKVSAGTKVEVLEQKVNGWSKVSTNGKTGYIKSEYLQMAEIVTGESIGTVTATTTVNVRMAPSQDAEKLGVLAGGDSAGLLERVDDWCKINYNGSVGYVKAEYVQ